MELGEFFRQQRLDSNLTIHQVAHGIISDAALSRFERGENELSTQSFLQLLPRLNGNPDYLQYGYAGLDLANPLAGPSGTLKTYHDWGLHLLALFDKTGWPYYRLAGIERLIITDTYTQKGEATRDMVQVVLTHLNQVQPWGTFEIRLASRLTRSSLLEQSELLHLLEQCWAVARQHATEMEIAWSESPFAYAVIACQAISMELIYRNQFAAAMKVVHDIEQLPLNQNLSLLYNQTRTRLYLAYHEHPGEEINNQFLSFAQAWQGTRFAEIGQKNLTRWKDYVKKENRKHDD
jgi:transcriptional regulator with XRE-family HTH domain